MLSIHALKNYLKHYSGLPTSVWQGITINLIDSILIGACYFLTIYFVKDLKFSVASAGALMSFYGVGTIFGGLFGGKFSDIYSPGKIAVVSLFIQALSFLALVKLSTTYSIMVDLFLLGIGSYGFITANHIWVLDYCTLHENIRLKALNALAVASNLGLGISAFIISSFSRYGFRTIFICYSILLLLSALYLLSIKNKIESNNPNKSQKNITLSTQEQRKISPNRMLLIVSWMCLFLVGLVIAQNNSTYPLYIESTFPRLGVKAVSILFMLNTLIVIILQTPFVNFFAKYNKVILMGAGAFLLGIGVSFLSISYIFHIAVFACIIVTIGEMLFFSVAQLISYEVTVQATTSF